MNRFLIAILVTTLGLGVFCAAGRAETRLRFAPPDSVRFSVTSRTVRVSDLHKAGAGAETTLTVGDYRLRRADSGWVLESKLRSLKHRPKLDSLQNKLLRLLIGIRTLLYINDTGQAVRMSGFEPLAARLDSIGSPTLPAVLKEVYSSKNLATQEINDWNMRTGNLIGRPLEVGRTEHRRSDVSLVDGVPWTVWAVTRFEDTVRIDGKQCLRAVTYADSDPRHLAVSLGLSEAALRALFELKDTVLPEPVTGGRQYRSKLSMTVEVATLLERAESFDREVILAVPGKDGKTVNRRTRETVEKALSYH
jgi:hypothetical protein